MFCRLCASGRWAAEEAVRLTTRSVAARQSSGTLVCTRAGLRCQHRLRIAPRTAPTAEVVLPLTQAWRIPAAASARTGLRLAPSPALAQTRRLGTLGSRLCAKENTESSERAPRTRPLSLRDLYVRMPRMPCFAFDRLLSAFPVTR